jgi:hypothetical protein
MSARMATTFQVARRSMGNQILRTVGIAIPSALTSWRRLF